MGHWTMLWQFVSGRGKMFLVCRVSEAGEDAFRERYRNHVIGGEEVDPQIGKHLQHLLADNTITFLHLGVCHVDYAKTYLKHI